MLCRYCDQLPQFSVPGHQRSWNRSLEAELQVLDRAVLPVQEYQQPVKDGQGGPDQAYDELLEEDHRTGHKAV